MKITDLLTLNDFIQEQVEALSGIDLFLALSNGEKAVDEISAYYNDSYAGCTAFFQVADVHRKGDLLMFLCSLTVAIKPANVGARAGLEARNLTMGLLLALLGQLDLAAEAAQEEIEDQGEAYDLVIEPDGRIFPIGMLANVDLEGHYVELNVTVPATPLLFPA